MQAASPMYVAAACGPAAGFWPEGGADLEAGVCAARVSDTLVAGGGSSDLATRAATQPAASRVAAMTVMEQRRECRIAPLAGCREHPSPLTRWPPLRLVVADLHRPGE